MSVVVMQKLKVHLLMALVPRVDSKKKMVTEKIDALYLQLQGLRWIIKSFWKNRQEVYYNATSKDY